MSRASKAYVSGYSRTLVSSVRLIATEKRSLTANFKAALSASQEIVSARWQLDLSGVATLATPAISVDGKEASCILAGYRWGCVACRCTVTLNDGGVLTQLFAIEVSESNFDADPIPGGSLDVTVSA